MKAFAEIPILDRSGKPRRQGLTMIVDMGLGLQEQRDILELAGEYIDLAKIAVGISRLLEEKVLRAKIELYLQHGVDTFPGGQFLEYAFTRNMADAYLKTVAAVGYPGVEVSDNVVELTPREKTGLIRSAIHDHGLWVLGEVGKKDGLPMTLPADADVRLCLEAGARQVLLEAAEFFPAGSNVEASAARILDGTGISAANVIFELPGPWNPGTQFGDPYRVASALINWIGPEVNLGNLDSRDLIKVEALRRGIGTNAGGGWSRLERRSHDLVD